MKIYRYAVYSLMLVSAYSVPSRADTGGAVPNNPSIVQPLPTAGAAQNDMSGAPKLVVEFQTGRAEIPASYSKNIKAFGTFLNDNPGSLAEIHGFSDHTGHHPANALLAQKRADAVKDFLVVQCAVVANRITAEGYGEISTKSLNSTEAGKQTNRSAIGTIVVSKS
jgi:outer membrane protein OmpA-like peptidoglycan-associated protein